MNTFPDDSIDEEDDDDSSKRRCDNTSQEMEFIYWQSSRNSISGCSDARLELMLFLDTFDRSEWMDSLLICFGG